MRRLILATTLFLAGCATAPPRPPAPAPQAPAQPQIRSDILGLTAGELIQRFGQPALQVREGAGLKLQFRGRACVLDAYLYQPAGGGSERVTHVDARLASGTDTDRAACIRALQGA